MNSFHKEALGTLLEIHIYDKNTHQPDIDECFLCIEKFENTYSRFKKGNLLSELNTSGKIKGTSELDTLISLGIKIHKQTNGYFDITLLPLLENAGYGISKSKVSEKLGTENIILSDKEVILKHGIQIDLGGLGKGYILDKVYHLLDTKYKRFTLNFGGDIRTKGAEIVGLEDPLQEGNIIGKFTLTDAAFCSSSGEKRKLRTGHHIINPKSQNSPDDKIAIYTSHKKGVYADAYATALYACPLETAKELLEDIEGLEALIIGKDGKITCSQGFHKYLTLY